MTNQRRVSDEIAQSCGLTTTDPRCTSTQTLHTNEKQLSYTQIQLAGAAEAQTLAYTKAAANAVPYIPQSWLPGSACFHSVVRQLSQEPAGAKFLPRDYLQN